MRIRLPYIELIETEQLPNNFEELVKISFAKFTEGTNKDYTFEDKLLYLDNMRKYYLRGYTDTNSEITKLLGESFRYQLDEYNDTLEKEEVLSTEFMEFCFDKGFMPFRDSWDKWSSSRNDKIHKVILKIIEIVVNFEWEVSNDSEV